VGRAKQGNVPMLGGADSKPDAKSSVHHLNDADNYLQVYFFPIFKQYCLIA
jgi:hypothetical protein